MKQDNSAAIRKRSQITQANRTMFIWIAIASALVGTAIVVSIFLFQKLTYGEKVLAAKQTTVSTLEDNLSAIEALKLEVRALDASSELLSVKANDSDQALQVVLDALPSEANSLALGASLQNRLLSGIDGEYTLESLQVSPVDGVEIIADQSSVVDASATNASSGDNKIAFRVSIKGEQRALKQVLRNLERSIRTIVVSGLSIETQGSSIVMSIDGHAFYQPVTTRELTEKVVPNK